MIDRRVGEGVRCFLLHRCPLSVNSYPCCVRRNEIIS